MNRIDRAFNEIKKKGKKAFIAFITAGYPSLTVTKKLILELEKRGVDIIELGVPFSDPMSDGPVIQEASSYALKKNTRLEDIINLVGQIRRLSEIPLLLMSYYNPIFSYGESRFIKDCVSSGVDGVIVPDLPFEEAGSFSFRSLDAGLYNISFISPLTNGRRLKDIARNANGFVYYVSLTGVTGMRKNTDARLGQKVKSVKKITDIPVCVGFGVSSRAQARSICNYADGVIVGSAIVAKIKENINNPSIVKNVGDFVERLI